MSLTDDKLNISDIENYLLLETKIDDEIRRVCKIRCKHEYEKYKPTIEERIVDTDHIHVRLSWGSYEDDEYLSVSFPTRDLFLSSEEIEQEIKKEKEEQKIKEDLERDRQMKIKLEAERVKQAQKEIKEYEIFLELKKKFEKQQV